MSPDSTLAHACTLVESFCGLMLTAVITGLMFAKMSHPRARLRFSDKMVVHEVNGVYVHACTALRALGERTLLAPRHDLRGWGASRGGRR